MELILGTVDISVLKKAFSQLDGAIVEAKSDLEKAGAIQYEVASLIHKLQQLS